MTIVLVVDVFDNLTNGTTMTAYRFAQSLRENGHEVRAVAIGDKEENPYALSEAQLPVATKIAHKQGFAFAKTAFHDGPELLFLISDLSHNSQAMSFIRTFGCEEYFVFSKKLEFQKERAQLLQEIDATTFNFRG